MNTIFTKAETDAAVLAFMARVVGQSRTDAQQSLTLDEPAPRRGSLLLDPSFSLVAKDLEAQVMRVARIVEPGSEEAREMRAVLSECVSSVERWHQVQNHDTRAGWTELLGYIASTLCEQWHTREFRETAQKFLRSRVFGMAVRVTSEDGADPDIFADEVLRLAEKNAGRVSEKGSAQGVATSRPRASVAVDNLSMALF